MHLTSVYLELSTRVFSAGFLHRATEVDFPTAISKCMLEQREKYKGRRLQTKTGAELMYVNKLLILKTKKLYKNAGKKLGAQLAFWSALRISVSFGSGMLIAKITWY